jgi:hypothetical protein
MAWSAHGSSAGISQPGFTGGSTPTASAATLMRMQRAKIGAMVGQTRMQAHCFRAATTVAVGVSIG